MANAQGHWRILIAENRPRGAGSGSRRACSAMKIFISHSSADKGRVKELLRILDNYILDYWIDEYDIGPGEGIVEKISDGLFQCDTMFLFISKSSLASRWVTREWNSILYNEINNGSKRIIPLRLDKSNIPIIISDKAYVDLRSGNQKFYDLIWRISNIDLIDIKSEKEVLSSLNSIFDAGINEIICNEFLLLRSIIERLNRKQYGFPRDLIGKWMPIAGWGAGSELIILGNTKSNTDLAKYDMRYRNICGYFSSPYDDGVIDSMYKISDRISIFDWSQHRRAMGSMSTDVGVGIIWNGGDINSEYRGLWYYENDSILKKQKAGEAYRWLLKRLEPST